MTTGTDAALVEYPRLRDRLAQDVMTVTSRIASLEWSIDELKQLHLDLSRAMSAEVEHMLTWEEGARAPRPLQRESRKARPTYGIAAHAHTTSRPTLEPG